MQMLRQYSPLVETYIQNMRPMMTLGTVPEGDNTFSARRAGEGRRARTANQRQWQAQAQVLADWGACSLFPRNFSRAGFCR